MKIESHIKQRSAINILLLKSGNVQPNPGPEMQCIQMPSDLKSQSGLNVIHLNVRSLLSKMGMVRIWVKTTAADIVVISETWLTEVCLIRILLLTVLTFILWIEQRKVVGFLFTSNQHFVLLWYFLNQSASNLNS